MHTQTQTTVPNGTQTSFNVTKIRSKVATTPKYQTYVENFLIARKKSSESILMLCKIVSEAESNLCEEDFTKFLKDIDLTKTDSTFRKYRTIGRAITRLQDHADLLPSSWTTIYRIARLSVPQLQLLVSEKLLSPKLTVDQIEKRFAPQTANKVSAGQKKKTSSEDNQSDDGENGTKAMAATHCLVKESAPYDDLVGKKAESPKGANQPEWKKHWVGMPEFEQDAKPTYKTLYLHFRNKDDFDQFRALYCANIDSKQKITEKTKTVWFPHLEREDNKSLRWVEAE